MSVSLWGSVLFILTGRPPDTKIRRFNDKMWKDAGAQVPCFFASFSRSL